MNLPNDTWVASMVENSLTFIISLLSHAAVDGWVKLEQNSE